jgi:predicted O-methyltransferase YrrM
MPDLVPNDTLARKIANTAVFYHGALQKYDELASLLEYCIYELKPESVLEIGCDAGGTLYAWSQLPTVKKIVGITLQGAAYSTGRALTAHGATIIVGDSHSGQSRSEAAYHMPPGGYDMLFLDGDHTYEGVKNDLLSYEGMVRKGGAIVMQDICVHPKNPEVEVHRVWAEYSREYPHREFIRAADTSWGGIGVLLA